MYAMRLKILVNKQMKFAQLVTCSAQFASSQYVHATNFIIRQGTYIFDTGTLFISFHDHISYYQIFSRNR